MFRFLVGRTSLGIHPSTTQAELKLRQIPYIDAADSSGYVISMRPNRGAGVTEAR